LLTSGVLLPDALTVVGEQIGQRSFQEVASSLIDTVHRGTMLSEALKKYPALFDRLTIQMAKVGQETGSLGVSLGMASDHMEAIQEFRKKVRSAALLPGLTFLFFIGVTLIVFLLVIPRFADMFASVHQELPALTRVLVQISAFLRSWYALIIGFIIGLIALMVRAYAVSCQGRPLVDRIILQLPFIGSIVHQRALVYFLRSFSMLLQGGMPLASAIGIAKDTVENYELRRGFEEVEHDILSGSSLSQAMGLQQDKLFEQDLIAIARVAEESGHLGLIFQKAAIGYQDKVNRSLSFFTLLMQPLLMGFLGLLVMALIFAVYLPIFNLSQVISYH